MSMRNATMLFPIALALAACVDGDAVVAPHAGPGPAAFVLSTAVCEGVGTMPLNDCESLVDLYNATGGPAWTNSDGWGVEPDPCLWWGVYCLDGTVAVLYLADNGLTGPIPTALQGFTNIRGIDFDGNGLTGPIGAWMGDLTGLEFIVMAENQLDGPIPTELGNLTELRQLRLRNNQLTGSIPAELGDLVKLDFLILGNNNLTGPIPEELAQLEEALGIQLAGNDLSGQVPLAVAENDGWPWLTCQIDADIPGGGNEGVYIPDTPDYRAADEDGDGMICGVQISSAEDIGEDAVDAIGELVPDPLGSGQANALQSKIDNAIQKAAGGQYGAAINQMQAFLNQLANMVADGTLTTEQAAPLVEQAEALIDIWMAMI